MPRISVKCWMEGCGYVRLRGLPRYHKAWRVLHPFPQDIATCLDWLKASGNLSLLNKSIKTIRDHAYICREHFSFNDFRSARSLEPRAVPKKLTHSTPIPDELITKYAIENKVEKYIYSSDAVTPLTTATCDHDYCEFSRTSRSLNIAPPAYSDMRSVLPMQ